MDQIYLKQIAASILSQDGLIFVYRKPDNDKIVVRFVTPVELTKDSVLCIQHLPQVGWRQFKLENIEKLHRVIPRDLLETDLLKKKTEVPAIEQQDATVAP